LHALARIFYIPAKSEETLVDLNTAGQSLTDLRREAAAARVLYFEYLNSHADFWDHVVTTADILAMEDVALAAITLIRAVATAHWQPLPSGEKEHITHSRFLLPSEDALGQLCPATRGVLPASGAWALLTPPAMTTVLPYLFKPPKNYSNFVWGGAGDTKNAIWKIASAKYDALVALRDVLAGTPAATDGFAEILGSLEKRVKEGPWGRVVQVGSRVDTSGM
jgi:hypothetical protein